MTCFECSNVVVASFRGEVCVLGYFICEFFILHDANYLCNTNSSVFVHVGPCMFIHAGCCWCVRAHGVRTVKRGTAQNGSERLFLREKRLINAQERGLCEANAGYAPRKVVCWWRGIVQLWHWREIRALAQALLWEKGASKVYIAISNSILFLGIRRGNTKKVQRDWSQHFRRLVPDTLPDKVRKLRNFPFSWIFLRDALLALSYF